VVSFSDVQHGSESCRYRIDSRDVAFDSYRLLVVYKSYISCTQFSRTTDPLQAVVQYVM